MTDLVKETLDNLIAANWFGSASEMEEVWHPVLTNLAKHNSLPRVITPSRATSAMNMMTAYDNHSYFGTDEFMIVLESILALKSVHKWTKAVFAANGYPVRDANDSIENFIAKFA